MTKHDARYIKETFQDVNDSVAEALASLRMLGIALESKDKLFFDELERTLVKTNKALDGKIREMHHRYHLIAERQEA